MVDFGVAVTVAVAVFIDVGVFVGVAVAVGNNILVGGGVFVSAGVGVDETAHAVSITAINNEPHSFKKSRPVTWLTIESLTMNRV